MVLQNKYKKQASRRAQARQKGDDVQQAGSPNIGEEDEMEVAPQPLVLDEDEFGDLVEVEDGMPLQRQEDEDPEDAERLRQFIAKQLTMSNDLDTNEQEERISNDIFRLKGKSMPKFGKSSESQAIAKDLQIDASTFEALLREQQERANISDREEYLRQLKRRLRSIPLKPESSTRADHKHARPVYQAPSSVLPPRKARDDQKTMDGIPQTAPSQTDDDFLDELLAS